MFQALIPPIFRSTRLSVTACGIRHPRCCRPVAAGRQHLCVHYTTNCNTQSSTPEDGRDQRPKHVELLGIINKPLLLNLVAFYIIYALLNTFSPFSIALNILVIETGLTHEKGIRFYTTFMNGFTYMM